MSKTALKRAVQGFDAPTVSNLLESNPSLAPFRDPQGRNWLHVLSGVDVSTKPLRQRRRSCEVAEVLLGAGVDLHAPAFSVDDWQATALWYATGRGKNHLLVTHLLDAGSSPEHCLWAAAYNDDTKMLTALVDAGATLDAFAEGETPLIHATKTRRYRAMTTLLDAGADPDLIDARGVTALHYLIRQSPSPNLLRRFLRHSPRMDIADAKGATAAELLRRKRDPALRGLANPR